MNIELFNEDCVKTLERIKDNYIDLLLQDMPYGVTQNKWDILPNLKKMWIEWERVTKENGMMIFTAQQPFASQLIMSNLNNFKYDVIWHKRTPTNVLNANKQPLRTHEHILFFYRKLPVYNYEKTKGHNICGIKSHKVDSKNYRKTNRYVDYLDDGTRYPTSVLDITGVVNSSKEKLPHPTQKPIKLFRKLIKTYSNKNDVVFDGYSGSGTTAIACIKENRHFIGSELNKEYYSIAQNRINIALSQPSLFEIAEMRINKELKAPERIEDENGFYQSSIFDFME